MKGDAPARRRPGRPPAWNPDPTRMGADYTALLAGLANAAPTDTMPARVLADWLGEGHGQHTGCVWVERMLRLRAWVVRAGGDAGWFPAQWETETQLGPGSLWGIVVCPFRLWCVVDHHDAASTPNGDGRWVFDPWVHPHRPWLYCRPVRAGGKPQPAPVHHERPPPPAEPILLDLVTRLLKSRARVAPPRFWERVTGAATNYAPPASRRPGRPRSTSSE